MDSQHRAFQGVTLF